MFDFRVIFSGRPIKGGFFFVDARGMSETPRHAGAQEITIKPEPVSIGQQLLGIAVDANELISQLHSGRGGDLNSMIQAAIDERDAETSGSMRDAA